MGLGGSFTLSYGGATTIDLAFDATSSVVEAALESLSTIGDVIVTRNTPDTQRGYIWAVTFVDPNMPGDLTPLISDSTKLTGIGSIVDIREAVKGSEAISTSIPISFSAPLDNGGSPITTYRVQVDTSSSFASGNLKTINLNSDSLLRDIQEVATYSGGATEIQVISATAASSLGGEFNITFDTTSCKDCVIKSKDSIVSVSVSETASGLQTKLNGLSNTGDSISVSKSTISGGFSWSITFTGGLVKGNVPELSLSSGLTGTSTSLTINTVVNGDTTSGTFRLKYGTEVTEPIKADADYAIVRNALENLNSITTCSVSRRKSRTALVGTVTVSHGSNIIITSDDWSAHVKNGDLIYIQNASYRIGTIASSSVTLVNDASGSKPIEGVTATGIIPYKWGNGYSWSVTFHSVPTKHALNAPLHSLAPASSNLAIRGGETYIVENTFADGIVCDRCYYVDNLSMGSVYWLRIYAINVVGVSTASSTPVAVTPKRVPGPPEAVKLYVVSGTELEVFFNPPTTDGGSKITGYKVEWDTVADFNSGSVGSKLVEGGAISGTPPYSTIIGSDTALNAGTSYYVRVRAINDVPHQNIYSSMNYNWQLSLPFSAKPEDNRPNPPSSVALSLLSGDSLRVILIPPSRNGGSTISHYQVEYDIQSTFNSGVNGGATGSTDVAISSWSSVGGASLLYDITGLTAGIVYYVRVRAKNSVGYSSYKLASPAYSVAKQAPSAPMNVVASTVKAQKFPIREIDVAWASPSSTGGNSLSAYKVEWFAEDAITEIQTIQTTNGDQGTFKISFMGNSTTDLAYDISDVNMRYALMNINGGNSIGHLHVSREAANNGYKWYVTFMHSMNAGDMPPFVGDASLLTASNSGSSYLQVKEYRTGRRANGGKSEIQQLTLFGPATVSGFWRASFAGSGFGNYIPWNADASVLKAELEMLSTIGIVTVSRTGDGSSTSCNNECPHGYRYLVTFNSNVGNVPKLHVSKTNLYSGNDAAAASLVVMDGDNSVDATTGAKLCSNCYPGETPAEYGSAILPHTTYSYRVTQRVSGNSYYLRVSAANDRGYGAVGLANLGNVIIPPKQQPGLPTNTSVAVYYGESSKLKVKYSPPLSDGGDPILKYMIEYDTTSSFSNAGFVERRCPTFPIRHTVTLAMKFKGGATSLHAYNGTISNPSTFKITLGRKGQHKTTQSMRVDANAMASDESTSSDLFTTLSSPVHTGSIQSNLENLALMGCDGAGGAPSKGVNVVRAGSLSTGYIWTITFLGDGNDYDVNVRDVNNNIITNAGTGASYVEFVQTKLFDGEAFTGCTETEVVLPGLIQGTPYFTRVIAYNTLGYGLTATLSTAQKPMRVPQSPSGVTVTVSSGTSLRVMFSPPADDGGDTIDKYKVEWDLYSNFSSVNGTSPLGLHEVLYLAGGAPFHYTITSLQIGMPYYIRVYAHNSQGYGLPQVTSPPSEFPREVPSAPSNVQLAVTSGTKLTVQYASPSHIGGDTITKYKIEWDRASSFSSLLAYPHKGEVEMMASQNLSYTINDLSPGAVYYVRVSAANSAGYGPVQITSPTFGSPSNQRPGKIINAALTKFNATTLKVSWDAPFIPAHGIPCSGRGTVYTAPNACGAGMGYGTDADGGSPITRYWIEWDIQSDFSSGSSTPDKGTYVFTALSTRPYQHFIKNLNPDTAYHIRILAYNAVGPGDYCSNSGFDCDGSALSMPQNW